MKKILLFIILFIPFTLNVNAAYSSTTCNDGRCCGYATTSSGESKWCCYDQASGLPDDISIQAGCPDGSSNDGFSEEDSPNQIYNPNQSVEEWAESHQTTSGSATTAKANNAADNTIGEHVGDNFCTRSETESALKVGGYFLLIARFIIPFIIILKGTIDFYPAVTSDDAAQIKKSAQKLGIQVIIGLLIFFIPTILNGILKLTGSTGPGGDYESCRVCLLEPTNC